MRKRVVAERAYGVGRRKTRADGGSCHGGYQLRSFAAGPSTNDGEPTELRGGMGRQGNMMGGVDPQVVLGMGLFE